MRSNLLSLICAVLITLSGSPTVRAAAILEPGQTVALTTVEAPVFADGVGETCFVFLSAACQTDTGETGPVGDPFGARATSVGTVPFSRGKGTVFQVYDFDVDASGRFGTVLLGQIFGTAKLNGFLAQLAGGRSKASLVLKVIDLGPSPPADPDKGKVIFEKSLTKHELQGTVLTGVNFNLKVEGGAPYIGIGGGPGLGVNIQLKKKIVRDTIDFGVQVLLTRGHSYQLQFQLDVLAKVGGLGGLSFAQFQQFEGPVLDLLDPENWLDTLTEAISAKLPNIKPEIMNLKEGGKFFEKLRTLDGAKDFANTAAILNLRADAAGLPKSFKEIVQKRFRPRTPAEREEGVNFAGAQVEDLFVTLQEDQVELLEVIIRLLRTPQGRRPGFPFK